jgi:hypothetical protein
MIRTLWSRLSPALSLVLAGCVCSNEVLQEVPSPGGQHKAVIFMRNCGATSGSNTQVSVLSKHFSFLIGGGNVFIADDDNGSAPAGPHGGPVVSARWDGSERLVISYDAGARVFRKEEKRGTVGVSYQVR